MCYAQVLVIDGITKSSYLLGAHSLVRELFGIVKLAIVKAAEKSQN